MIKEMRMKTTRLHDNKTTSLLDVDYNKVQKPKAKSQSIIRTIFIFIVSNFLTLGLAAQSSLMNMNTVMAKSTMGTKLPRKLEQKMQVVGEQIRLARLRRNLSVAQVAERATCSPLTVSRIEKGVPTVAIGIYLRVLYALQLDDDILFLAKDDELGRALQDMNLPQRERASKKE